MDNITEKDVLSEQRAEEMIKSMVGGNYAKKVPTQGGGVSVANVPHQPIGKPPNDEIRLVMGIPEGASRGTGKFKDVFAMQSNSVPMIAKPQVIETEPVIITQRAVQDEEINYRQVICPNCLIQELIGCDYCGIFQYAWKRNEYKINVTKQE